MSADEQDLEAIAEEVQRGEDPYVVPEEMLVEPEQLAPANKSLYMQIVGMAIGEKIKLALKGNRDARAILIRYPNRLIQRFVLQNPRISDEEVIAIARNRNLEGEVLRRIGEQKHWARNYQIRLALVTNSKTPLATALHFVGTLAERDLRSLAKSKNVSATVATQARRLLAQREPH